jgi:hypothetical protein
LICIVSPKKERELTLSKTKWQLGEDHCDRSLLACQRDWDIVRPQLELNQLHHSASVGFEPEGLSGLLGQVLALVNGHVTSMAETGNQIVVSLD